MVPMSNKFHQSCDVVFCLLQDLTPRRRRSRNIWGPVLGVIGVLASQGPAFAEPGLTVERAARLFQGEKAEFHLLQVAQEVGGGFAVADISGAAGTPIPVKIQVPPIRTGAYNFVMFRYLPAGFKLSAGFPVEDRWVVSLDELPGLTMTAPEDFRGSFQMEIKLRIGGTDQSQTRTVSVSIFEPGAKQLPAEARSGSQTVSPELEHKMMARAEALLDTRDIAGARMLYSYLAKKGSSKAAFALGRTYDPDFLKKVGVVGMDAANVSKAREWYERAAQLGHKEARERLKMLAAGTR